MAKISMTTGAHCMGTMASLPASLENMPPKMFLALGMISLAVMAKPTPTIQPRPRELLMPEAKTSVQPKAVWPR